MVIGFLIFLSMSFAVFLPLGYVQYRKGLDLFEAVDRSARERAENIMIALIRVAQEDQTPQGMVTLSSTMGYLVEKTRTAAHLMSIDEVLFVDRENRIQAHSDFIKVARDSSGTFDTSLNDETLTLTQLNPVGQARPLEKVAASGYRLALVKEIYPHLLTDQYLIGAVVRTSDDNYARGTIQMRFQIRGLAPMAYRFVGQVLTVSAVALALVILSSFVLTILVFVLMPRRRAHAVYMQPAESRGDEEETPDMEEEEMDGPDDFDVAEVQEKPVRPTTPTILDAIPLQTSRR